MKWNWKVALVLVSAGAGLGSLAWSQAPAPQVQRPTTKTERFMTVHENGKALRCRVLQTWQLANGATAHQLQVLDTGELMTIVEDGPATLVPGADGQVRALPMRIYHWGSNSKQPPAGSPEPPMLQVSAATSKPEIQPASTTVPAKPALDTAARTPVAAPPTSPASVTLPAADCCETINSSRPRPRIISGSTDCTERGIRCDSGHQPAVVQGPAIMNGPGTAKPFPSTVPGERLVLLGEETRDSAGNVVARPTTETVVIPERPVRDRLQGVFAKQPTPAMSEIAMPAAPGTVVAAPAISGSPMVLPTTPAGPIGSIPSTISPAISTANPSPSDVHSLERYTLMDRLRGAFNKSPGGGKPSEPTLVQAPSQTPAVGQVRAEPKVPFTTATAPMPAGAPLKQPPLVIPGSPAAEVAKKDDTKPASAAAVATEPGSEKAPEWRKMWGQSQDGKVEQPGLSTVQKERGRADLNKGVPPVSQAEQRKGDILMNPEKFNPDNERVNPKVPAAIVAQIPSPLNQGAPPSPLPQAPTTKKSAAATQTPPAGLTSPHTGPTGPTPTPLGVQSVLASKNGAQGPVTYVPVPVATVPEPIRPPLPPEPQVPLPPNPTAYVNAFTPPQPLGGQQQPPLPQQAMMPPMNMYGQPMMPMHPAYGMQPGFPMHPAAMQAAQQRQQMAQLVPVMPGRAPVMVQYPANYGGPQPPNPFAAQQQPQALQAAAYNSSAATAGYANQAMDRRMVPGAAQEAHEAGALAQLISVLQDSPYPAQREWAATNLSTFDWRLYPQLTQVLVKAARHDAAPTVRAAAVYGLSRLNAQTEPVLSTLQTLRGDADPRVRQEVEQAYTRMGLTRQ